MIVHQKINTREVSRKNPFFQFRRIDLSQNIQRISVPFVTEQGGNYLLRRLTLRWSGETSLELGNPQPFTVSMHKLTSSFQYMEEIPANLFCSPAEYRDCTTYLQPAPVDNDIFSYNFRGTQRLSYKTFNTLIDSSTVLELVIVKDVPSAALPKYLDIIVEGYFIKGNKL
jgi:hypothetical protein